MLRLGSSLVTMVVLAGTIGFEASGQETSDFIETKGGSGGPPPSNGTVQITPEEALRLLERLESTDQANSPRRFPCRLYVTVQAPRDHVEKMAEAMRGQLFTKRQAAQFLANMPVDPSAEPMEVVIFMHDDGLEPRPDCQPTPIDQLREIAGLSPRAPDAPAPEKPRPGAPDTFCSFEAPR